MGELPTGTVTFLFTDIEGSTRLLKQLRERYVEAYAEHQRILRAAFDVHGGREVHTEGDAFFVAFIRAGDAIAAAVAAQRALASQRWHEGAEIRVRMGVHTGEAEVRNDDYVGLDVHRAARICSAGHGGQVVVSSSTRELVVDELPADVALKDLGEHQLKDLDRPERLFQVVAGDLPADFPPLASVAPAAGATDGLPPSPNRTIGREEAVREVADRLGTDTVRLLTLTGPGGVGKTRLATEVARAVQAEFADGARFVPLAAVSRASDVPAAILQALKIMPLSGETAEQAVARFLSPKDLLLVLDNVEHLLEAARVVSDLLAACPTVKVLATSREPLDLAVEACFPVMPLELPVDHAAVDALARVPAVALFAERARAHDPRFEIDPDNVGAVVEICRRVDGLPLAIELAAARCSVLSPAQITERLDRALAVLGTGPRDAPARQRTLRATVDWSHDLLGPDERAAFARFAVFAGGATVDAAEAVTGASLDTLEDLVAKSLLVRTKNAAAPPRLMMLETIRAYANERFAEAPDADAVRERHYSYYLSLAQRHGAQRALWSVDGGEHRARLDADIDNLHAALGWAVGRPGAGMALALAAASGQYWLTRDRYTDALDWIDQTLGMPGSDAQPELRVDALCTKAWALWPVGRVAEQRKVMAEAEAVARALGDPAILAKVLQVRSAQEAPAGRIDLADALADEALQWATTAGDDWALAMAAFSKAMAASTIAELRPRVDRAAALLGEVGNVYSLADLLASTSYVALIVGSDDDAKEFVARATDVLRGLDYPFTWMLLRGNAGLAALFTGDAEAAREAFREELALCRRLVVLPFASEGLAGLGGVDVVQGDYHRAARLFGASAAHRYGQPRDPVYDRLDSEFFEPARTRYGPDAWDAAAREGGALSFEEAIAYALQEPS
jgi:predicted ATPase/class 3 adenylate cyclase